MTFQFRVVMEMNMPPSVVNAAVGGFDYENAVNLVCSVWLHTHS